MNVVSLSLWEYLPVLHSPFLWWYKVIKCYMMRWSGVNDTGIVTQCQATTDLMMIHQKEDHLLPDRDWPQVTETTDKGDYCTPGGERAVCKDAGRWITCHSPGKGHQHGWITEQYMSAFFLCLLQRQQQCAPALTLLTEQSDLQELGGGDMNHGKRLALQWQLNKITCVRESSVFTFCSKATLAF